MSRRQIREQIFLLLFSTEFFSKDELDAQLSLNMQTHEAMGEEDPPFAGELSEEDAAYIEAKVRDISDHLDEIDELINAGAENWKTTRMAKAELAIIRLAVYEMKYEEEIPVSVAINEAVELAKVYGGDKGAAFVNGVLAKLV
ncbi:MAG: transcription antitermination factor NusB [Lachnospiraceae bacterium]|nr:transcription antitermination factor NusB [Lachnospiraceae bacterium]